MHAILGIAAVAESAEAETRLAPKTRFNYARLGHHASPTARKILRHPTVRKEDHHHHYHLNSIIHLSPLPQK